MGKWEKYIAGIYKFVFPNGKIYIGKSINIKNRWSSHKNIYNNSLVSRAIKKYGWENIQKEIIVQFLVTPDINKKDLNNELLRLEIKYIALYRSNDLKIGYNLTIGGEGVTGYKCTDEHKLNLRKSHLGKKYAPKTEETRRKLSEANKGKRPSNKCLEASRKANLGSKQSEETKLKRYLNDPRHKRIAAYDTEGNLIKVFFSLKEASEYVNAPYQGIQRVLKGQRFLCRGLHWKYYETETN